jgi:uncharacterized protein YndB with AHSA1/START domain
LPERLVFNSDFVDSDGNKLTEAVNTVTFIGEGTKTRMMLNAKVLRAVPEVAIDLTGMEQGWIESLKHLATEVDRAGRGA